MCEFLENLKNWVSSLFETVFDNIFSKRNSINQNGNININIHIDNITPGSKGKIDSDNQTLGFMVASATTEKIKDITYTVCCIIISKENTTDILFLKGEFLPNQSIDLKAQTIDSQDKIKGGNYYLKQEKEEKNKEE